MTQEPHRVLPLWAILAALSLHGAVLYAGARALPEAQTLPVAPTMTIAWVVPAPDPAPAATPASAVEPAPAIEPTPAPPKAKASSRTPAKSLAPARSSPPPTHAVSAAATSSVAANEAGGDPAPAADTAPAAPARGNTGSTEAAPFTEPRFDAAYLANPRPSYPPVSRRLGEQGKVILRVLVGADGLPRRVELERSSGYPRLDRAASEAVERWKFVPARRGDTPVEATVLVPIAFSLSSS
jgi:protein TonB